MEKGDDGMFKKSWPSGVVVIPSVESEHCMVPACMHARIIFNLITCFFSVKVCDLRMKAGINSSIVRNSFFSPKKEMVSFGASA